MDMEISDGARMIIERMESHPEEFAINGRLEWVFEYARDSLPAGAPPPNGLPKRRRWGPPIRGMAEVDARAILAAYQRLLQAEFTEAMVRTLVGQEDIKAQEEEDAQRASQMAAMAATVQQQASAHNRGLQSSYGTNMEQLKYEVEARNKQWELEAKLRNMHLRDPNLSPYK